MISINSKDELSLYNDVTEFDAPNSHDKDGYKYAYIRNEVLINGELVGVRISVKKKVGSNHFWIHNIDEYKKLWVTQSIPEDDLKRDSKFSVTYLYHNIVEESRSWIK